MGWIVRGIALDLISAVAGLFSGIVHSRAALRTARVPALGAEIYRFQGCALKSTADSIWAARGQMPILSFIAQSRAV